MHIHVHVLAAVAGIHVLVECQLQYKVRRTRYAGLGSVVRVNGTHCAPSVSIRVFPHAASPLPVQAFTAPWHAPLLSLWDA